MKALGLVCCLSGLACCLAFWRALFGLVGVWWHLPIFFWCVCGSLGRARVVTVRPRELCFCRAPKARVEAFVGYRWGGCHGLDRVSSPIFYAVFSARYRFWRLSVIRILCACLVSGWVALVAGI